MREKIIASILLLIFSPYPAFSHQSGWHTIKDDGNTRKEVMLLGINKNGSLRVKSRLWVYVMDKPFGSDLHQTIGCKSGVMINNQTNNAFVRFGEFWKIQSNHSANGQVTEGQHLTEFFDYVCGHFEG